MLRKGSSADVKIELLGHHLVHSMFSREVTAGSSAVSEFQHTELRIFSRVYLLGVVVLDWLTSDQMHMDRGRARTKVTMSMDAGKA